MNISKKINLLSGDSVSYNTKHGAEIYRRSLIVLLQAAIKKEYPNIKTQIGQTLMHGYYFEILDEKLPDRFIDRVSSQMEKYISEDENFKKKRVSIKEAVDLFAEEDRSDKVRALSSIDKDSIELVYIEDYFDYVLTEVVKSAGILKTFKLMGYNNGFILQFPVKGDMRKLPSSPDRQENLYKVYVEKKSWDSILGVRHVSDLVEVIKAGETEKLIKIQEAFHDKKISSIAGKIKEEYPSKRVIFIAGPSASGKTTFIKRLGIALRVEGLIPHEISLDDFFHPREKTPRTKDGDYDFESVGALDTELFSKKINELLEGKKVGIPEFDFKSGSRKDKKKPVILEDNSVVLIEGIHGLNPEITDHIEEKSFGIFVSALTQLCIDSDTRIFTSDSRLMRRIVRDNLFRGYSAYQTIKRFPKVRDGEDRYIFPYQSRADIFFNSSLIYEQAVLKPHLLTLLNKIDSNKKEYYEARRVLEYLTYFKTIPAKYVPDHSILREFIGKSSFDY